MTIEKKTRQQRGCDDWYVHRKGRITASIMGSVLKCNMEKLSDDNFIMKKVQCSSENIFSTKATEYGKAMESVARNQYCQMYSKSHSKSEVLNAGLCISPKHPFIAASPDGFVKSQCCGEGLVEIKCTFTHQHKKFRKKWVRTPKWPSKNVCPWACPQFICINFA